MKGESHVRKGLVGDKKKEEERVKRQSRVCKKRCIGRQKKRSVREYRESCLRRGSVVWLQFYHIYNYILIFKKYHSTLYIYILVIRFIDYR